MNIDEILTENEILKKELKLRDDEDHWILNCHRLERELKAEKEKVKSLEPQIENMKNGLHGAELYHELLQKAQHEVITKNIKYTDITNDNTIEFIYIGFNHEKCTNVIVFFVNGKKEFIYFDDAKDLVFEITYFILNNLNKNISEQPFIGAMDAHLFKLWREIDKFWSGEMK